MEASPSFPMESLRWAQWPLSGQGLCCCLLQHNSGSSQSLTPADETVWSNSDQFEQVGAGWSRLEQVGA
eukprot:9204166-Alexandrium_andersonii.AAC.1